MPDRILGQVQVGGRWFKRGDEAALKKADASKDDFARWRIAGQIEGFENVGKAPKYETDADVAKRPKGPPPGRQ